MPKYVEYGSRSFGEIVSETPKTNRRPEGYNVLPLNTGSGDGHGVYTDWYPKAHVREADMSQWSYDAARNMWCRTPKGV